MVAEREPPPPVAGDAPAARSPRRARTRKPTVPTSPAPVATLPGVPLAEGFRHLSLSESTLAQLAAIGWSAPTPIQHEAIPSMLAGDDVVGRARTGTGKTAAFGLPILERLDASSTAVQAIVLVPTRELAVQVAVLDEADEMLDIGFAEDMERILRRTPKERQTALFSATLPPFIRRMIIRYMRDPIWVNVIDPDAAPTVETVDQIAYDVSERDKVEAFVEVYNDIEDDDEPRILVFRRTQIGVDRLAAALKRRGGQVAGLHGGMRQPERDRTMTAFKSGEIDVLVATNVAARGLDIPDVTHVVNYDVPQNAEEYIHRIGRTARAGKSGHAITFVGEWDYDDWGAICTEIGINPRKADLKLYKRGE